MTFKRYNGILLGLVIAFLTLVFYLALTWEPFDGDLTRVGALPESRYGWNGEKTVFDPELVEYRSAEVPVEGRQVLVLGDSFSHQSELGWGWQNFLIERTGLAVVSYNLHAVHAEAILGSPALRRRPPALVVYESAELNLPDWIVATPGNCARLTPVPAQPIGVSPIAAHKGSLTRTLSFGPDVQGRIDQAMYVIKTRAKAALGSSNVRRLGLDRDGLFTSRSQDLLVYGYEISDEHWRNIDVERIACGMRNLESMVSRRLGAPTVFLLVPSKLSVYAQYVPDAPESYRGFIERVVDRSGIPVPDLLQKLSSAVAEGLEDVYLPNNSHWSDLGHRIAADALYDFLLEKGLIRVQVEPPVGAAGH